MISHEISIPVYFSKFDKELEDVIEDISKLTATKIDDETSASETLAKRDSALNEIINSISANGYQVCT